MEALGVIPVRFGSTRFPGKALAKLRTKPIIQWVYENAKKASLLDKVVIATDDEIIFKACQEFKAKVLMTSSWHKSGTERVAEVVQKIKADIVLNIQGDEPFLRPGMINRLVREFTKDKKTEMATLATRIKDTAELDDPNVVKVVFDKNGYALYFSRSKIPFLRVKGQGLRVKRFKHLGIYAYKRNFLLDFVKLPVSNLERMECLEQLRALENGFKIKVIEVKEDTVGIDTPEDLERAKKLLNKILNSKFRV